MVRSSAPAGATIVSEELKNEAKEKINATVGHQTTIADFLAAKRNKEEESREIMSSDLEIIEDVNFDKLMELQGRGRDGRIIPGLIPRLYGYSKMAGRQDRYICCVLKMIYLNKTQN